MPPPPNTPVSGEQLVTEYDLERDLREYSEQRRAQSPSEHAEHPSRPSTPDSSILPPSPQSRQSSPSTIRSHPPTRAGTPIPQYQPPDRGHPPPRPPRSPIPTPPIDYQDLEYVDDVDETLICPICRTPFHEPITTKRCGHTFCTECLRRAVALQPCCPIDRQPIAFHPEQLCNPRIVSHQLDRLRVRCPNAGCGHVAARGAITTHYERHCERTLVPCRDLACGKLVPRRDASSELGCLHRETRCRYCDAPILLAERERHYDADCEGHTAKCPECNAVVVRHRMAEHVAARCPEAHVACSFHASGCSVAGRRRVVEAHEAAGCVYEAIGKLARDRAEDRAVISDLRGRLTALERIRGANSSRSPRSVGRRGAEGGYVPDLVALDTSAGYQSSQFLLDDDAGGGGSSSGGAWESPEDYMLAQFERMEAKIEDFRKMLTELDGRHSMMLLNETMPLKDQITELRSNFGVINMHTTWLMNVQRQNRVAAGAGGVAVQGQQQQQQQRPSGGASGGETATTTGPGTGADDRRELERQRVYAVPRRMSAENPPRL